MSEIELNFKSLSLSTRLSSITYVLEGPYVVGTVIYS